MTSRAPGHRVAVVGSGIAGLTAAYDLLVALPAAEVTVFEATAEVGGKLRVGEVAGRAVDLGAESMLYRRPEAIDLASAVGLGDAVVHPAVAGAGVWTRGRVRLLPPSLMGIPADLRALARSGILSRPAVARASVERRLPPPDLGADVGIGVLVARRLGREVRDRLVEPLLGGVYAGRSDELSLHAALPQLVAGLREHGGLLLAAEHAVGLRRPGGAPAVPVFAGLSGGVGRLALEVADAVRRRGGVVVTGTAVRALRRTPGGWTLLTGPTSHPVEHEADAVVLAVPAAPASRLLRDEAPVAARELARIEYASMAIVSLALRADTVQTAMAGSGFLVPPVDGRVVKAATYSSQKWAWPGGDTVHVRCSVGRHRDETQLQHDDGELVRAVMSDLREAVGLQAPPLDARVTRWGGALPQYAVGHLDRVRLIRESVDAVPLLEVCGAAYDGVGIPAVIATAHSAATRVADALRASGTMRP